MKRDKQLDAIRGFACIFMIFAHAHGYGKTFDNWFTLLIYQIGLYAPVIFLASVGVSVHNQVKHRPYIKIVASYLLLFIFSFANSGLRNAHYINFSDWNLYACISISALISLLFQKKIHLFTSLLPILIFILLKNMNIGISLLYGGLFSLIPWTSFTLIGLYIRTHMEKYVVLSVVILALLFVATQNNTYSIIDDYNTPLYIIFGIALYLFTLKLVPLLIKISVVSKTLIKLGRNSLLFYVIHRMLIIYLPFKLFAPLIWVSISILTIVLMALFIIINRYTFSKYSNGSVFWVLLLAIMASPYIISANIQLQRTILFFVLILHALNYHNFSKHRLMNLPDKIEQ